MRPILLSGHERSLNQIKFNREGDLLFSCSKDHVVNAWFAHNGERLGTYDGNNGTVWSIDPDCEYGMCGAAGLPWLALACPGLPWHGTRCVAVRETCHKGRKGENGVRASSHGGVVGQSWRGVAWLGGTRACLVAARYEDRSELMQTAAPLLMLRRQSRPRSS